MSAEPDCNQIRRRRPASRGSPLESCSTDFHLGPPSNRPESVIHATQHASTIALEMLRLIQTSIPKMVRLDLALAPDLPLD